MLLQVESDEEYASVMEALKVINTLRHTPRFGATVRAASNVISESPWMRTALPNPRYL